MNPRQNDVKCTTLTSKWVTTHSPLAHHYQSLVRAQPAITRSKLTIETLKQDVKYVQIRNENNMPLVLKYAVGVVLVSLLLT